MRKALLTAICSIVCAFCSAAIPPSVHIEGRNIVDSHGNTVVMHGVMDTPSCWFNGGRWGWMSYDDANAPAKCIAYFDKLFTAITDTTQGAYCNVFRLHLDPAWTNNSSVRAEGFTTSDGKTYDPDGVAVDGEASTQHFDKSRLSSFMTSLYYKLMLKALNRGLHVVVRPPGVCPSKIRVGGYYQQYLMTVWDIVSKNSNIKKYSGQISIELANEPVEVVGEDGKSSPTALHDFFQPIADKIRANGFTGIIWIPGSGWQSNYRDYADHPIEGYNIGYAVHAYVGWYGCDDKNATGQRFLDKFVESVPVVKTNPVIVTEIDWSPENEGEGHYNEHGEWVVPNYGTWATGTTSHWGNAFKYAKDQLGNVSMTLTGTGDLIDIDEYINNKKVVAAFTSKMTANGLDPAEACGQACLDWYKEYAKENCAYPDFANVSVNMTADQKRFINPVIAADFPDPDVARLGDTYYMLSTTMYLQPGATLLKSTDLVNWQYCCNPLEQLSAADKYCLVDGQNSYAGGMWAGAIEEHDGKLYILINGNDAGGFVLSADDPEGKWEVKKLARSYYDPGMIFEGDRIYIACGIGNIDICELDKDWNFIKSTTVIRDKDGLEGSHLYKIGDYYYIYATYGGWPSGQAIFRSTAIDGAYEEKMLIEKMIDGTPNTVHQGALIETQTGEWWTMLMEDKGAIGRMPSLHPVKWDDGWPTLCQNGVPQLAYARPNTGAAAAITPLQTNDNFRHYKLGLQWQWNHNAPAGDWSLLQRPGYLRLHTSSVTDDMMMARGTLTQRIVAFHKTTSPFGLDTSRPSIATIALDVSGMKAGDMAGIAVQQDPYAMLAVARGEDGGYSLVWKSGSHTGTDNFTPAHDTAPLTAAGWTGERIYLRAQFNCGSSEATFFYSLDNKAWTAIGGKTTLRYNLSVFVGARWAIFNYATIATGGYADIDWFTTEDEYEEAMFASPVFEGYSADMLTATGISSDSDDMTLMVGTARDIVLNATFADGHTENVAAQARYTSSWPELISIDGGRIKGHGEGKAEVTATYTDPMGNEWSKTFTVASTYFPFAAEYIKDVWDTNTYTAATRVFKTAPYGQMGWEYSSPVDMSGYKYLVLLLDKTQSCDGDIRLYAQPSIWGGSCFIRKIGTSRRVIIKLQTIKYTDGDEKNKPVDIANIYKVVFWSNGSGAIDVGDMYLTNNDDYSREEATGIDRIEPDTPEAESTRSQYIYDLQGRRITTPTTRGIYIKGGRKVVLGL